MGKIRVTKKQVMEAYCNVYYTGYCDLQGLLTYKEPAYYTAGAYGWGADVYILDACSVLVTGYAPFGTKRLQYGDVKQAEAEATQILRGVGVDYDERITTLDEILARLIEKNREA